MHKSCIRTLPVAAAAVFGFAFTHAAFAADNANRSGPRAANSGYALSHATMVRQPGYRNDVCCKRGRREWWSSPRQCRRSGGTIVSRRLCRHGHDGGHHGRIVCCKWRRHGNAAWTARRRCVRSGGHIVSPRACRRGGHGHHDGGYGHHDDGRRDHRRPRL